MTFQRKEYQETALDILETYLEAARVHGAQTAFERITTQTSEVLETSEV